MPTEFLKRMILRSSPEKRTTLEAVALSLFVAVFSMGCDQLNRIRDDRARDEQISSTPVSTENPLSQRFVFPTKSTPFPETSVALDTKTGQLCKTYSWDDNQGAPKGLPLCSQLAMSTVSLAGASKVYRGFMYTFDGRKWNKGSEAKRFKETGTTPKPPRTAEEYLKQRTLEPRSDDQYDPLNLFTKDEKAKRLLTEAQIRRVADEFGVSYAEALEDAKAQGYQVPTRPPLSSFERK